VTEGPWWSRHAREVDEVLAGGDPSAIKRLYMNLGGFLEDDYRADVDAAPLLSRPETTAVVIRLLRNVRGILLDAGCGPNPAVAIALGREHGRTVVALDIGAGTVRLAVARAARAGVDLLGVVGDVEALPFRTRAFAGGVCDDTIEHLPDDDRGAHELGRVLTTRGRMVVATPNRHSLAVVGRKLADRPLPRTTRPRATCASTRGEASPACSNRTWCCAPSPASVGREDGATAWRARPSPCPGCAGSRGCWLSWPSRVRARADGRGQLVSSSAPS
jgi:SAM-dependent methyltransferase